MNFLRNQNGMSMVSVMMAAAAMGAIALVSTQLVSNSKKSQAGLSDSMAVNDAYNTVQRLLLKSEHCKAILQGATIPANGSQVNLTSITTDTVGGGSKTHYSIGANQKLPGTNVEFTSLTAKREAATPKMVTLEALFTKKGKSFGGKTLKKRFYLEAAFTANQVTKCFSQMDNAVESACKSLDTNANFSSADCDLSTGFQEEIVANGLSSKKRPMWLEPTDGSLKTSVTYDVVVKTNRHNHYCNCYSAGIACPSGFTAVNHWCDKGRRKGRCTGAKSRNGYKKCRKARDPIGYFFVD